MKKKSKEIPHTGYPCAAGGCREPGDFKAPKSRWETGEYQYLCIDHIREFNRAWNFFEGWNRDQIESFSHSVVHGHRPTWSMSERVGGGHPLFTNEKLQEAFFRMMGEEPPKSYHKPEPRVHRRQREALSMLDLEPGTPLKIIKAQYKKLVKKYHPDVNKDKASAETFKLITAAYSLLIKLNGTPHED